MNKSQPSTQQVDSNAVVEELTSVSTLDAIAPQLAEESSHTTSEIGEILPRTTYCPPPESGDADSDPEYSPADDVSPVVGRASSVRVGKPQLIEHWPSLNLRKSKHQGNGFRHSRSSSHSSLEAEQVSEPRPYVLPIMPEEDFQEDVEMKATPIVPIKESSLAPSGHILDKSPSLSPRSSPDGNEQPEVKQHDVIDFAHPRTVQIVDETAAAVLSPNANQSQSLANDTQAQDASDLAGEPSPGLNRAFSSPFPAPRGLSRRVTIRPADLVIKPSDRNASFRQTIVTTPYPPRRASDQTSMNFEPKSQESSSETSLDGEKKDKIEGKDVISTGVSVNQEAQQIRGEKDRFPSPERPEVLFINLSLLNHPAARTIVEIQISDKGTFDDELLFHQVRTAYSHRLLGFPRLFLILFRKVGYATVTIPANFDAEDFDSINFIRHFHKPCLGRKRKAWVIWLRNHNPRHLEPTMAIPASALLNATGPLGNGEQGIQPLRKLSNLKSLSPRTRTSPGSANHSRHSSHHNKSVHTDRDINNADLTKRFSTASQASSYNFVYSPAFPRLPFLSSRHDNQPLLAQPSSPDKAAAAGGLSSPCRTYFWPSSSSSMSRCGQVGSIKEDAETTGVKIVTVSFYHQYRVSIIVTLTILNVLLAVLVTALWVVFGVPGTRPSVHSKGHSIAAGLSGQASNSGDVAEWEVDARKRVLTGVVIGLVTLLVGGIAEGTMVWAARELL